MAQQKSASQLARVTVLLVCGTLSSLLSKIMYQTEGPDLHGHWKPFQKPWASTAIMFLSMALCLPLSPLQRWMERRKARSKSHSGTQSEQPLLRPDDADEASTQENQPTSVKEHLRAFGYVAIPTAFDLVATSLMNVGLLWVTASVYQMLRGTQMVFSAILVGIFLHRHLNKFQTHGLALAVAGITLVGISSLLSSSQSEGAEALPVAKVLTGMALIVASQAVQAGQTVVEDYYMSEVHLTALHIVAYEGLLGSIAIFGVFLPIAQFLPGQEGNGIHEDSIESWHMLMHSHQVQAVVVVQLFVLAAYNVSGMLVTDELGAVTRSVVENARTLFVWLADLVLYYTLSGKVGEAWDRYSWVQLIGFAVMTVGTTIYGKGDAEKSKDAGHEEETPDGVTVYEVRSSPLKSTMSIHTVVRIRRRFKRLARQAQEHLESGAQAVGEAVQNGVNAVQGAAEDLV